MIAWIKRMLCRHEWQYELSLFGGHRRRTCNKCGDKRKGWN